MPSSGTYSLKVTDSIASTVGTWNDAACLGNPFTNNYLTTVGWATGSACAANAPANVAIRFLFSLVAAAISLDGDPLIAYAGLPAGWLPTSAELDVRLASFSLVSNCFIQFDAATEHEVTTFNGHKLFTHPNPSGLSALDLFSNGWGVRLVTTGINAQCSIQGIGTPVVITGNYIIGQTWTITTAQPVIYGRNSTTGADRLPQVTVVANDLGFPGQLDDVTEIHFAYTDAAGNPQVVVFSPPFITQTQYVLIFTIPIDDFAPPTVPLPPSTTGVLTGVTFSGSIPLGTLEILLESGSGIYRIVSGKRNDTIYITDGDTQDVKIPNPFGKTGFIGG